MPVPPPKSFVCTRCWSVFFDGIRLTCSDCKSPQPEGGWSPLPHRHQQRYLLQGPIARGGMGAVFRADDLFAAADDPREVAVKLIPQRPDMPSDARALAKQQFERERGAATLLASYPQFIKVLGGDATLLVMEHVNWPTLNQLPPDTSRTVVEVANLGAAILDGVAAMHRHGIVHRDLKPSNIFVERSDATLQFKVKIADLGACLLLGGGGATTSNGERTFAGTPGYMSPEQVDASDAVDVRSDLHTIASILWEALMLRAPYPLPDVAGTEEDRIRTWRRSMDKVPAKPDGMDAKFYAILAGALSPDRTKRFHGAAEFATALREFVRARDQEMREALEAAKRRVDLLEARARELVNRIRPVRELDERLDRTLARIQGYKHELPGVGQHTMMKKVSSFDEMDGSLSKIEESISTLLSGAREVVHPVTPSASVDTQSLVPPPGARTRPLKLKLRSASWGATLGGLAFELIGGSIGAVAVSWFLSKSLVTAANAQAPFDLSAEVAVTNPWLAVNSTWSMQTHEVTRREYARWRAQTDRTVGASVATPEPPERAALPVTDVDWFDARDFCRAIGGTLPTAAVWATARGDSSLWRNANALRPTSEPFRVTVPRLGDVSPDGFMYLLGGVREWLAQSGSQENPTRFSTIGGSYAQSAETDILLSESPSDDPMPSGGRAAQREHDLGFRCAKRR